MSLSRAAYTFSFIITQGSFTFLSAFIASTAFLLSSSNAYKTNGDPSTLYLAVILFGFSQITLSMAVSTIIKSKDISFTVALWTLLLPFSIYIYCLSNGLSASTGETLAMKLFPISYVLPNFPFSVLILEFYVRGGAASILGLDLTTAWVCLALSTPFYLIIYFYLDATLPSS